MRQFAEKEKQDLEQQDEEDEGIEEEYEEQENQEEGFEEEVYEEEEYDQDYGEEEEEFQEENENSDEKNVAAVQNPSQITQQPDVSKNTPIQSGNKLDKANTQENEEKKLLMDAKKPSFSNPSETESKKKGEVEKDKRRYSKENLKEDENGRREFGHKPTISGQPEKKIIIEGKKMMKGDNRGRAKEDSWGSIGEFNQPKPENESKNKGNRQNLKKNDRTFNESNKTETNLDKDDLGLIQEKMEDYEETNKSLDDQLPGHFPTMKDTLNTIPGKITNTNKQYDLIGKTNTLAVKAEKDSKAKEGSHPNEIQSKERIENRIGLTQASKYQISDPIKLNQLDGKFEAADKKDKNIKIQSSTDHEREGDFSLDTKDFNSAIKGEKFLQNSPSLRERETFRMKSTLSKRSIGYLDKDDKATPTISPLLSKQPTFTMPAISKPMTPKASDSGLKMEPVKALPFLKSSSRQIASREGTPDKNHSNQKVAPSSILNKSPKYIALKHKDPLVALSKVNFSKPQLKLTPVQSPNLNESINELSRRSSLRIGDTSKNYSFKKDIAKIQSTASNVFPENDSIYYKLPEKPFVQGTSNLSSRRSSKTILAPIVGLHDSHFDIPKKMVSKQVGLGYSSLNNSKLDSSLLNVSLEIDQAPNTKHLSSISKGQELLSANKSAPVLLLNKIREYCENKLENKFLTLSQIEKMNQAGENLKQEFRQINSTVSNKRFSIRKGLSDLERPVSNYTKSTLNYIKARYKKDIESNNLIAETMGKELARLNDLVEKINDPQYNDLTQI